MTKKILIPTDFSANALSAALYAAELATQKKWALDFYHNYTALSSAFSPEELTEEIQQSELLKADISMQEFVDKIKQQFPTIAMTSRCETGLLTEQLPRIAAQEDYVLIVMGSKGTTDNRQLLFGSNTYKITQKSPLPVLAIPLSYDSSTPKNIGLLSNFKEEELSLLSEFIELFGKPAKLHLMHVKVDSEELYGVENTLELWRYRMEKNHKLDNLSIAIAPVEKSIQELDTVPEVINTMIQDLDIDLLLVNKTRKSFFKRIFVPSVSKSMALHLIIPTFFSKA